MVEALHLAAELRDVIVLAVEVVLQPVAQLNLAAAAAAAQGRQQVLQEDGQLNYMQPTCNVCCS
jgi:hypothetical protein